VEIGHTGHGKTPNEGRTEGRNHEKSNQERHESEKLVTNFVKNRVQEGQFTSLPENSKVSKS
jgi:GH24 family phage-related lysozyme (muramidase)